MGKLYDLLDGFYLAKDIREIEERVAEIKNGFDSTIRDKHWYKDFQIYTVYPDAILNENGKADLDTLRAYLQEIKYMGFNAIHLLPAYDSPMVDYGFDVSDYKAIRSELGGNLAIEKFLAEAERLGLHVFMDLILNHVSNEHDWYQKAVAGERKYQNYFITKERPPKLVERFVDEGTHWARYEINGVAIDKFIIFPEQTGEIPHWEEGNDPNNNPADKKPLWYYHTFYPQQLDLNWGNPNVFLEFVDIISYWAKRGVSFRLDAILFVGKDIDSGHIKNTSATHQVIAALNYVLKQINPNSVFLAETFEQMNLIRMYFGKEDKIECEIAYNFQLASTLWAAIITGQAKSLAETIEHSLERPNWGQWINFVRNHDELSFEIMDSDLRKRVMQKLIPHGLPWRGDIGLAGRSFSLLKKDLHSLKFIYAALASLPGNPGLIYGDEYALENNYENMERSLREKSSSATDLSMIQPDTRDINRGQITSALRNKPEGKEMRAFVEKLFNLRAEKLKGMSTSRPEIKLEGESKLKLSYKLEGKDFSAEIDFASKSLSWVLEGEEVFRL
ncbi:MAG: alpha-amylase family glycosyl hydrolase [Candidatus Dojkabacteria bacterium]